jgi:adenylate kinase
MNLIITGNPGVGKHTVAAQIMKTEDYDMIDINKIAIESNYIEKDEVGIEVDVQNLKKDLNKKISTKSLIVGHLAPYVIEKPNVDVVIILRKNPYQLEEIYETRGYSKEKIKENLGSEILGITAHDALSEFGTENTFQIDTTTKTPQEVVEKIQKIIQEHDNDDNVDWLSEINEKDDLQKFFDY